MVVWSLFISTTQGHAGDRLPRLFAVLNCSVRVCFLRNATPTHATLIQIRPNFISFFGYCVSCVPRQRDCLFVRRVVRLFFLKSVFWVLHCSVL